MDKEVENNMEDRIIFNSLGLLSKEEKAILKSDIDNFSGLERNDVQDFNNLTSLFPKLLSNKIKDVSPSLRTKEKLFEKINANESEKGKNKEGFGFLFSDDTEWTQHPEIEGIKSKTLALNQLKGYLMLLLKVKPGTTYPAHHHTGDEECYVISGDVYAEGKTLGPGDFHHATAGSEHDPIYTKNGCTLLLVVDPVDYT